jgi:hypothetical protein
VFVSWLGVRAQALSHLEVDRAPEPHRSIGWPPVPAEAAGLSSQVVHVVEWVLDRVLGAGWTDDRGGVVTAHRPAVRFEWLGVEVNTDGVGTSFQMALHVETDAVEHVVREEDVPLVDVDVGNCVDAQTDQLHVRMLQQRRRDLESASVHPVTKRHPG